MFVAASNRLTPSFAPRFDAGLVEVSSVPKQHTSQVIVVVPDRSAKVRGWHFNCAYVIYGAGRATLAKLFATETQFIGLRSSCDLERTVSNNCGEWRIFLTHKQVYSEYDKQQQRERRRAQIISAENCISAQWQSTPCDFRLCTDQITLMIDSQKGNQCRQSPVCKEADCATCLKDNRSSPLDHQSTQFWSLSGSHTAPFIMWCSVFTPSLKGTHCQSTAVK